MWYKFNLNVNPHKRCCVSVFIGFFFFFFTFKFVRPLYVPSAGHLPQLVLKDHNAFKLWEKSGYIQGEKNQHCN